MVDLIILTYIHWYSGETFISFDEAVSILRQELNYPEDRALHFVKRFDHNKDGRLSAGEFGQFKSKIAEVYVTLAFRLLYSFIITNSGSSNMSNNNNSNNYTTPRNAVA